MKNLNEYILEKYRVNKSTLSKQYLKPKDKNAFSLDVIKDFLKEDVTESVLNYIEKWAKDNEITFVYYYIFKGKKAYNRFSDEIKGFYNIETKYTDQQWDNTLPSAWNGGHDPDMWIYNEEVEDKALSDKRIMVFGNKECILIRYEGLRDGFEGELFIDKKIY